MYLSDDELDILLGDLGSSGDLHSSFATSHLGPYTGEGSQKTAAEASPNSHTPRSDNVAPVEWRATTDLAQLMAAMGRESEEHAHAHEDSDTASCALEEPACSEATDGDGRPTNYVARASKLFSLRAKMSDGAQYVAIQATHDGQTRFYAYDCHNRLNDDTEAFRSGAYVREWVDPRFQRLGFVDVDSKNNDPEELAESVAATFGGDGCRLYRTTKGFHAVAPCWVTRSQHRDGLEDLKELVEGVDLAMGSLRLAGTLDKKGRGRKEHPAGLALSETLVQPLGAPLDEDNTHVPRIVHGSFAIEPHQIAAGIDALTLTPGTFEARGISGGRVALERVKSSLCLVCGREHDSVGAFLVFSEGQAYGRAYCFAGDKGSKRKSVAFRVPDVEEDVLKAWPGVLPTRATADEYSHVDASGREGVRPLPDGDVIEGSPCSCGKSTQCWAALDETPELSVLLTSYRKSFSRSQGAAHRCTNYEDVDGALVMTRGRRYACQYEALKRVEGMPDVLILDELHGIFRQACGNLSKTEEWRALCELVRGAGRVIVLDALATDEDRAILEAIRGKPFAFCRSTAKPHTSKTVTAYGSRASIEKEFKRFLAARSAMSVEERLANRFTVVAQWKSDVERFSELLARGGVRHKAYHGKTCPTKKAEDFANHAEAWADCEAIVYNSTLEAGVSIEEEHWSTCWAFLRGMGHVESAMQGLHRFRAIKTYRVHAARAQGGGDYPTSSEGVKAAILANETFVAGEKAAEEKPDVAVRPGTQYVSAMVRAGDDLGHSTFARMWMANVLEGNRSARHWPARFYARLTETGFEIQQEADVCDSGIADDEAPDQADEATVEACRVFKDSPAERTAGADAQAWAEELAQTPNGEITRQLVEADIHARDKLALMAEYGLAEDAITPDFVAELGGPRVVQAHRNTAALLRASGPGELNHARAAQQMLEKEQAGVAAYGAARRPRTTSPAEAAARALIAFNVLGFDGLEDCARGTTLSRATVERALEDSREAVERLYQARGRVWPEIRRRAPPKTLKGHLGAINAILEAQYGVKVAAMGAVGGRQREFSVVPAKRPAWPDEAAATLTQDQAPAEGFADPPLGPMIRTPTPEETLVNIEARLVDVVGDLVACC